VGNAVFTKITGHAGLLHSMASSSHFLPILFGLGAINLAKNPDGALALTVQQRAERKQRKARRQAGRQVPSRPEPVGLLEPATTNGGPAPLLRLDGIRAGYGEAEVLHGIDLPIEQGRILALLGSNGAGKSTLCRVAAGLLEPAHGRVYLNGEDMTTWPAYRRARAGIMLAPEARGVFPGLTVEDNLAVWLPNAEQRLQTYEQFPILGERRHLRAGLLSGGEQQMLALAGALVRPPQLIIADEPTLGLAPLAAAKVCETLGELREKGTSVLLVEEKTAEVLELADTVALVQLGRIVWIGPRSDLDLASVTSAYLGSQPPAAHTGPAQRLIE
jgi:ABC-type branched-subunit amino acid transport system ATPase component